MCLVLCQCKSSVALVKMYDGDTESENASSVKQDIVFLCQKIGSI